MKQFSIALIKKSPLNRMIILFIGFFTFLIFIYGYLYERNNITFKRVLIKRQSLQPNLKDIKMIQFSDLHFKTIGIREKRLRNIINRINPDIIFYTGDLHNSTKVIEDSIIVNDAIEYLKTFSFKKYFFFVLGEEEYYFRDYLKKRLTDIDITVLDNEIYSFALDSTRLNIIGITEDTKNLDTFYNSSKHLKKRVRRFNEFMKAKDLDKYQDYKFYIAGQYTLKWENYEITGQFQMPSLDHSFGIAFYSQFAMGIHKSYFLELNPASYTFHASSTTERNIIGKKCYSLDISRSQLYQFKINVINLSNRTSISAKIWESSEKEPEQWQIDCFDSSENRSSKGTIGLIFQKDMGFKFSNIKVRMLNYDIDSKMSREGVKEIPLNTTEKSLIEKEWMTLYDITNYLDNRKQADKQYLLEILINQILKENELSGYNILVSHSPSIIKNTMNKEIDLVLTGHTHGGQINLPFVDIITHDSFCGQVLKSGLLQFSGTHLYINRGIGTSIIPVRLNCPPEITQFKFID